MRTTPSLLALARSLVAAALVGAFLPAPLAQASGLRADGRSSVVRPTISVALGRTLSVSAPGVGAGWADLEVTGAGPALVVRFADGYGADEFAGDYETAMTSGREAREAFARLLGGTTFLGGASPGGVTSIKLPRPGTYTVLALRSPRILNATFRVPDGSSIGVRPTTDGRIEALQGLHLGGTASLPPTGRVLLINRARKLPHLLVLQRVREGTTAAEYREWLYSNEAEPDFNLPGRLELPWLSPHRRMTVAYRLPPGQYVVMCLLTDPWTRIAHVFAGELRMIHLE